MPSPPTIVLLEPCADLRELFHFALEAHGYRVVAHATATPEQVLAARPAAVILAAPPRRAGATRALVAALRRGRLDPRRRQAAAVLPVVIASTYHGDVHAELLRAPRVAMLLKPFPPTVLVATLGLLGVPAPDELRAARPGARARPRTAA